MPADAEVTAHVMGFTADQIHDAAAGAAALALGVLGYFGRRKPPPAETPASAVAVAMAAPLGDANQLRLIAETLNRLADFAEHGLKILEDVKDEQERTVRALGRNEDSNDRFASALRDLADSMSRARRD